MGNKEVTNFVKKAKVTEANLNRLERRIKHRAKNPDDDCGSDFEGNDEEIPEDVVSCYSCPSVASTQVSGMSKMSHTTSLSQLLAQGKVPQDYEWSRLDEYAQFLAGQDVARTKEQDKDIKLRLKTHLDKQVVERQKAKAQLVEDEKKYYDNLLIELEEWKCQQKKKAEEREKVKLEEERIVKQVVEEIAADKKAQEKKKEKEKKAILKV